MTQLTGDHRCVSSFFLAVDIYATFIKFVTHDIHTIHVSGRSPSLIFIFITINSLASVSDVFYEKYFVPRLTTVDFLAFMSSCQVCAYFMPDLRNVPLVCLWPESLTQLHHMFHEYVAYFCAHLLSFERTTNMPLDLRTLK